MERRAGWWMMAFVAIWAGCMPSPKANLTDHAREQATQAGESNIVPPQAKEDPREDPAFAAAQAKLNTIIEFHNHPDVRVWLSNQIRNGIVRVEVGADPSDFPPGVAADTGLISTDTGPVPRIRVALELLQRAPEDLIREVLVHETRHAHQQWQGRFIFDKNVGIADLRELRKRFESEAEAWEYECDYAIATHIFLISYCQTYKEGSLPFLRYELAQQLASDPSMAHRKAQLLQWATDPSPFL